MTNFSQLLAIWLVGFAGAIVLRSLTHRIIEPTFVPFAIVVSGLIALMRIILGKCRA